MGLLSARMTEDQRHWWLIVYGIGGAVFILLLVALGVYLLRKPK